MKLTTITWIGLAACLLLAASCFMPWAYFADGHIPTEAQRTFTGFYSYQNYYGKPGYFLSAVALLSFIFLILPNVVLKRVNLFITAFTFAYAIFQYTQFTSCYNAYCPEKKPGIFLMVLATLLMLIAAIFPKVKVPAAE